MRRKEKRLYMKKLKLLLPLAILVLLILCLQSCVSRQIKLYPLTDKDIYNGKNQGDVCFSQYYLNEVMQVKIENHR